MPNCHCESWKEKSISFQIWTAVLAPTGDWPLYMLLEKRERLLGTSREPMTRQTQTHMGGLWLMLRGPVVGSTYAAEKA